MTTRIRWRRRLAALIAAPLAGLMGVAATAPAGAEDGPSQEDLPVFEYQGMVINKEDLKWNPTNELIFPSLFHASEHLDNPLGEWYLYYAPHEDPGGIALMYADTLAGPWTEYESNPLISNEWDPYYAVSHVSAGDAFWNAAEGQMYMYYHGENDVIRYATSDDGITFDYGGEAITTEMIGDDSFAVSYQRIFEHPDPDSSYPYAMFFMENQTSTNIRIIRVAESMDGRDWDIRPDPIVTPGPAEGQNAAAGDLWEWDGQLYIIYHGSTRNILARTIDPAMTEVGEPWVLYESPEDEGDSGAAAAPIIESDDSGTWLYYESGDRLGGTVAHAKLNPDAIREPGPEPDPDPLRELCSGPGSDEFEGDVLDADLWSITQRADESRNELRDGSLVIPTYHTAMAGSPLFMQAIPKDGPWEITTEVTFPAPEERFQQAGLVMYADDDNYIRFALGRSTPGLRLDYMMRRDGTDNNRPGFTSIHPPAGLEDTFWLRLTSDGEEIFASISVDGKAFTPWAERISFDQMPVAPTAVGLYAMRGDTESAEVDAEFSWFRWTPTEQEEVECAGGPGPEPTPDPTDEPTDDPTDDPSGTPGGDPGEGPGDGTGDPAEPAPSGDAQGPDADGWLPSTGLDAALPAVIAAALLLVGGASVLIRRRLGRL